MAAAAAPARPTPKPRILIVVPSIVAIGGGGADASYSVTIPKTGKVLRVMFGIAHGPAGSDPWQLDVQVKLPGGGDLFNNGRSGDFCNVGLLMGGVGLAGSPPGFSGGASLDVHQPVRGNDLWTFTFRNLSPSVGVLPRAALLIEDA